MDHKYSDFPAGRQQRILLYAQENGNVQIKELTQYLGVSEATVRRDLDELDAQGLLERTHGGAVYKGNTTSFERQQQEKMNIMFDEKRRIAKKAASFIRPGETILLDSGSTAYYLASNLGDIPDLTIVTYDLFIASSITLHPTSTMVVTGGMRRKGFNNVLLGSMVEDYIRNIHVDKVFLGADAIDYDYGISNANMLEASIKKLLVKAGNIVFLIADHSKLNRKALAKVCDFSEIDALIIDDTEDKSSVNQLEQKIKNIYLA
ncbi:MAG: DeoR/GlpR family DNA-binding transcription regulator [Acetivibrionales bacterium]